VQPYKVVAQTCYANDCALTVSPALASSVTAGTTVTQSGTCPLFATAAATPTGPLAPNGIPYMDGCNWGTDRITISNNYFQFDPAAIAAGTTSTGKVGTTCTAAHADGCGYNFMAFQMGGQAPFGDMTHGNAMVSNSLTACPSWDANCTTNPLKNINSLSNPPYASPNNGEPPSNNTWANNTYAGPWKWYAYWYGLCGTLPGDAQTGHTMPAGSCNLDFANWQSTWQQDAGSTYSASIPSSPPGITPPPTYLAEDINQDGHVNLLDFSLLAAKFGQSGTNLGRADINGDAYVNILDFSRLAAKFGT
jgi:hypothetical protein